MMLYFSMEYKKSLKQRLKFWEYPAVVVSHQFRETTRRFRTHVDVHVVVAILRHCRIEVVIKSQGSPGFADLRTSSSAEVTGEALVGTRR